MSHSTNDVIVYGMEGVCRVAEKVKRSFGGIIGEYYVLKPLYNENAVIYAPVDSEATTSKMRRVLSEDEIYSLIEGMPNRETIWVENEKERKELYRRILTDGDRQELVRIIHTIYLHGKKRKDEGKKLHLIDERFMKEAEKILYGEFAHVLDIEPDQVPGFIISRVEAREESKHMIG